VARLLRTGDGSQIWRQEFSGRANELSAVVEESARAVLRELRIPRPKDWRLTISRVASLEAYDLCQRAVSGSSRNNAALLEQAIALDPQFAPAHARLALAYAQAGGQEALARAKTAAARALQLDDQLSEAHLWRALLLDHYDLDWAAAESEYIRALDLDPSSTDGYYFFSVLLTRMGRFDKALSLLRQGQEIAPWNLTLVGLEGWALGMQRHYDQSIDLLRKHLEAHPKNYELNLYLGDIYLQKGDFERALLAFETIETQARRQPLVIGLEGYAHAVLGHTSEAHKLLQRLERMATEQRVPSTSFAFIYIGLGNKDAAFEWLEKALIDDRFMLSGLKVWPVYDSLHNDPRYFGLLTKLGLN
jgi:serine/threonine-protein kinase